MWDWLLLGHRVLALALVICMLHAAVALCRPVPASAATPGAALAIARLRAPAPALVIGGVWLSVLAAVFVHPELDHRLLGCIDLAAAVTLSFL